MIKNILVAGIFSAAMVLGLAVDVKSAGKVPLETAKQVELTKYLGLWYEIARFPVWFQKSNEAATADYSLRKDGNIKVLNTAFKGSLSGETRTIKGKAWVVDKATNAKLKVQFFWPFSGDYWIIQLGDNYEYAVVGAPKRDYLWILSRTPNMDEALYQKILKKLAEEQGYDVNKIIKDPR